ncbi:MAG: helix-turn-helix domain-containing protein [Bacteriovorax sp.]|jgi:excisionase family DNA binding protein
MNLQKNIYDLEKNRLLNSDQVAEYLGFKRSYIYNLVHKGILKPFKCGKKAKGRLRFLISDLDKFLGR